MSTSIVQRLVLAVVPALVIGSIALSTVWGSNGLVARWHLRRELDAQSTRRAAVDRDNQRLLRDIDVLDKDPEVVARVVAEDLSWGPKDATIYRFGEAPQVLAVPTRPFVTDDKPAHAPPAHAPVAPAAKHPARH